MVLVLVLVLVLVVWRDVVHSAWQGPSGPVQHHTVCPVVGGSDRQELHTPPSLQLAHL